MAKKEEKDIWIDVHDNTLMVALGFRYPDAKPRDPSVWEKTPKEKEFLKKLRRKYRHYKFVGGSYVTPYDPFKARLTVYIKPNKKKVIVTKKGYKHYKTVLSYTCSKTQVPSYLKSVERDGFEIVKCYWNNKLYNI